MFGTFCSSAVQRAFRRQFALNDAKDHWLRQAGTGRHQFASKVLFYRRPGSLSLTFCLWTPSCLCSVGPLLVAFVFADFFMIISLRNMQDLKNFDDPKDKRKCGLYSTKESIDNDTMPSWPVCSLSLVLGGPREHFG